MGGGASGMRVIREGETGAGGGVTGSEGCRSFVHKKCSNPN
jgi:hypothetical protein